MEIYLQWDRIHYRAWQANISDLLGWESTPFGTLEAAPLSNTQLTQVSEQKRRVSSGEIKLTSHTVLIVDLSSMKKRYGLPAALRPPHRDMSTVRRYFQNSEQNFLEAKNSNSQSYCFFVSILFPALLFCIHFLMFFLRFCEYSRTYSTLDSIAFIAYRLEI